MFININGEEIKLIIKRKSIKNVYFRWIDDTLVVSCNKYISKDNVLKMIKDNEKSLLKLRERTPRSELEDDEVYYLGSIYTVNFDGKSKAYVAGDEIICKDKDELAKFFKEKCNIVFFQRMNSLKEQFHNLPDFTLKIRFMKSRWGVCNKGNMTITLNSELIKKDVALIDYVIIHELCHFKYMNHGEDFWREVSKYYPYYKLARKMLREV